MNVVGLVYAIGAAVTWELVYIVNQKVLTFISLPVFVWHLYSYGGYLTVHIT
ncbi:MAG: hypothetical protein WC621_01795 [Patescibacteria group bacterium]